MHFLFYLSNSTRHIQRVWKHSQRETPGPLRTVNWWMCLSKTPPLMLLCGFPEESLIHCWFDLLLCCVSASERCVKTGYLPRSVGERERGRERTGQAPEGLDKHRVTTNQQRARQQPAFSPSVSLSSLFWFSLYLSFLISIAFQFNLWPFVSLPTTAVLPCPPFLCLALPQHNVYLWKEVETCFIWLPSFRTYKRAVDTLVWSLFHAE